MRGLGYFLGITLGAAVIFFIISYIFLQPRTINKREIAQFLEESDQLLIGSPIPFISKYDGDDVRLGGNELSKIKFFSNRGITYVRAVVYTYFSEDFKKYVRTYIISEGGGMNNEIIYFGKRDKDKLKYPDMIFYYNKTQNSDPTFGTIDKPLPILHFRSSDPALRSMRQNNKDADPAYLKMVYEENVKLYLEYFIEKEDFKKLFPDS